jgi:hypothetical protein
MNPVSSARGVALVAALLLTMLMSAMVAGFLATVNADQASSGVERDQTQAYAAAHAGVEKLTADLGQLFTGNFSPTGAQVDALATGARQPNLPGVLYNRPDGTSGYRINYLPDGAGNPSVRNPNGSQIVAGPFAGLVGLITPYEIEVTARTIGAAEVKMRREFQTVAIPVFQFGLFSENDLSFFAGPNFSFGGKVHTNQNLYLKHDGGNTLTLRDRVTAVGEVVRQRLANGLQSHTGTVRMARASGCQPPPTAVTETSPCFELGLDQGSVVDSIGSGPNENWGTISMGTSNGWLRNGRTGARRLDLPVVSDGAEPVDLIRRPPAGENVNSAVGRQRFYNMATLRILLSDTAADITGLPGVVANPYRLAGPVDPAALGFGAMPGRILAAAPFAVSEGDRDWGDRTSIDTPRIDGWLSVEMQRRDGTWLDVTRELLSLGFIGRRLSNGNFMSVDPDNACANPHPNAILRLQRVSDRVGGGTPNCGTDPATGVLGGGNPGRRYWPNVLYDAREGAPRDSIAAGTNRMWWSGVMHYVEFDVDNFRRWLRGDIGVSGNAGCANGAGGGGCPMDVTGFVVYFSDRRNNRNLGADGIPEPSAYTVALGDSYNDDRETGEFGWEDNINPGSPLSVPNAMLDAPFVDVQGRNRFSEDLNANGALDDYGRAPRLLPAGLGVGPWPAGLQVPPTVACPTPVANAYDLWNTPVESDVARVSRAFFFRRALKLVNGGRGNLPANGTQGLTVAAENPVYVQGNFNACTNANPTNGNGYTPGCVGAGFGAVPGADHVSAAVIADAVTFLSNRWNDIRSFDFSYDVARRPGATTWYRLAIIAGKHLNFPRPTNNGGDHTDFGTDGGAHNFIRYIENWGGQTLNYRGSLVSLYTSRQAVGLYKCCDNVYSPPSRGYNFDTDFLTPSLLPPRTPMFRDLNTLTFRQILRPTQ